MIEPLDTGGVRFYLDFDKERIQIAEPIKFDAANFVIQQKEKGLGRDVSFASGKADLVFSPMVNKAGLTHCFDQLIDNYKNKGFETDINFIIEIEGQIYVIGQLDFAEAETDLTTYFNCKVIQENKQALIKRRSKVKVDLFSDEDLDGNPIAPLESEKMFLEATPFSQVSEWDMAYSDYGHSVGSMIYGGDTNRFFNPFPVITKSGIEDTLSASPSASASAITDFKFIRAENTITKGKLVIDDLSYYFNFFPLNKFPKAAGSLWYYIGSDFQYDNFLINTGAKRIFDTGTLDESNPTFTMDKQTFVFDDLTIQRGEYLLIFFRIEAYHNNQAYRYDNFVTNGKVTLSGISTSMSSVIRTFNLGDAMKQVVRSISGMGIDAPRFLDKKGDFKMQYITDGLRIRNIIDEPFYLSLDDIEGYLPEIRGGHEVGESDVFFGIFKDFYKDKNIGNFEMLPNEEFKSTFNKEYSVNTFEMKYAKFSSDNEEDGSREAVHCSLQMLLPNKMVENNKAVNIGFIRDSFLLETTRKTAIKVDKDVATINDGDIFIIDCVKKRNTIDEYLVLNHLVRDGKLKLLNDASFNWLFTGIEVGTFIELSGENDGIYIVKEITETVLTLNPASIINLSFSGEALTRIQFLISKVELTNRTTEGVDFLEGVSNSEGFSNLFFTPKRNIYNFWADYLLTASIFHKEKPIRMTEYLYNKDLKIAANDWPPFITIEGADIMYMKLETVSETTLTPFLNNTQVLCDFPMFWAVREKVRTQRGFIQITTNEDEVVQVYPKKLDFDWKNNILTIEGERKNLVSLEKPTLNG